MIEAKSNRPTDGGIQTSIFGPEESLEIIESLKERYPDEPFAVLHEFLKMEASKRDQLVGEQNWADALNVVTPACCYLEEILQGKESNQKSDLKALERSLEDSRKTQSPNLKQREILAAIYLNLRGILCLQLSQSTP